MKAHIVLDTPVTRSARVMQMEGMFDVPPQKSTHLQWNVDMPLEDRDWSIGLIVGPSGSGKSTVARKLWPGELEREYKWDSERSILDSFPETMPIKSVIEMLNSVGFSSPPAWVRPFHVLSTGEQFRVTVARAIACALAYSNPGDGPLVLDEFTSVVDRTVAQIGSSAVARTIRAHEGLQFVAVTCHYDVEDWLQPDWVYSPATEAFAWRSLQRRPAINLEVCRVHHSAWALFRHHHYLDSNLNHAATCFAAFWDGQPVAFSSWLSQPHGQIHNLKREHRTVVLPDFQGVGIGNTLSAYLASMWRALGYRATSTTSHPSMVRSRAKSPLWRMHRTPSRTAGGGMMTRDKALGRTIAIDRLTSGFEYVGPPMDRALAKELLNGDAN